MSRLYILYLCVQVEIFHPGWKLMHTQLLHQNVMWYLPSAWCRSCSTLFTPLSSRNTNVPLQHVIFRLRGLEVREHGDFSLFQHKVGEKCHVLFVTLRLEQVNNFHALKHEIHLC